MSTQSAEYLEGIKKYGKGWYRSYAGSRSAQKHTLVITPLNYPNILHDNKSIYPRRAVFDKATEEARLFYESRGLKVIIAGPEGLGGDESLFGELLGAILAAGSWVAAWVSAHPGIGILSKLLPVGRSIKAWLLRSAETRRLKAIRSVRTGISLSICLYIDEGAPSDDIIPYVEQLLLSASDLSGEFTEKMGYLMVRIDCTVCDIRSDRSVYVEVKEFTPKQLQKTFRKLRKSNPNQEKVRIEIKR